MQKQYRQTHTACLKKKVSWPPLACSIIVILLYLGSSCFIRFVKYLRILCNSLKRVLGMSPFTSSSTHKEGKRTKRFNHSKFFRVTLLTNRDGPSKERKREKERDRISPTKITSWRKKVFFLMNALGENMWDQSILGE